MISYKASPVGIKDLYCKGINPLRCVVCQEKRKLDHKMTCDDVECVRRFSKQIIKQNLNERQTAENSPKEIQNEQSTLDNSLSVSEIIEYRKQILNGGHSNA